MSIVLAHGCFDLLHVGHIKHLQEAKKLGDRLIVSITNDKYVGKGMGRPRFTAEQRAEALKALACVDEVIIANAHDAIEIIQRVRPSVYVKGVDYKGAVGGSDALTKEEHEAVAEVGGRIHITETEKFSSSNLLRSEMFTTEVAKYLEKAKHDGFKDRILDAFDEADTLLISFVGEVIIDEYRYVRGLGKSSKEMMLAVVDVGDERFDGGSIAASKHGEWKRGEWVDTLGFIKKTRYVDKDFNRKVFDVYSADQIELSDIRRKSFQSHLTDVVTKSDVVVAMDFGHGLLGEAERKILQASKFLAVNAQSNAGNYGFNLVTKYNRADFICIDDPEARLAAVMQNGPIQLVMERLWYIMNCDRFLITHGKFGSHWRSGTEDGVAPAFVSGGIDTMGAGDAVMAVTAPLIAAGLPLNMAAFVGNIAGAIKTSIVGHRRHVNRKEIIATVEALLA